jgi:uncharacterized tellurite resistance protein B-like protein
MCNRTIFNDQEAFEVAKKKKSDAGSLIGACLIGFLALLAAMPKEIWIGIGVAIVFWLVYFVYAELANSQAKKNSLLMRRMVTASTTSTSLKISKSEPPRHSNGKSESRYVSNDKSASDASAAPITEVSVYKIPAVNEVLSVGDWIPSGHSTSIFGTTISSGLISAGGSSTTSSGGNGSCLSKEPVSGSVCVDESVSNALSALATDVSGYKGLAVPEALSVAAWSPSGQTVDVADVTISGGMIYVEGSLTTPNGVNDPGLIAPSLSINIDGDCIQLVYRPASAGFRGAADPKLTFGDIPDVTVLAASRNKLQVLVDSATEDVEPCSRRIWKNPAAKTSLEGLLRHPTELWPDSAQVTLQQLVEHIGTEMVVMTYQELLTKFNAARVLTSDNTLALARALESMKVGIEPDMLGGAELPKSEDCVVLFSESDDTTSSRGAPVYQIALMTLQLASVVAMADGKLSIEEMKLMREMVQSWSHLAPNLIRRLLAQLRLLMTAPVSLAALKKKIDPLDAQSKDAIAAYMAGVAHSDGAVSPAEIKMLEQVYEALGIDARKVCTDIHKGTSAFKLSALNAHKAEATGLKLDYARIAALQQDTEKVAALLANIFKDEEDFTLPNLPLLVEQVQSSASNGLMGLDQPHSKLVRVLLARPQWSRKDLLDVTSDLELMLDGALELINEAAFDTHNIAFIEGNDLMEVNIEILEKIEA